LLLPAVVSLALFAWLLTLHGAATGRVYAAYGGVYIGAAIAWLWVVDGVRPSALADVNNPEKYESQWPANAGYGAGKRPRSATIVITKNDGGLIGA